MKLTIDGENYVAMYRTEGRQLKVLELLPQADAETCVQVLLRETGCEKAIVCLQPPVMATSNIDIDVKNGYFNLTMG